MPEQNLSTIDKVMVEIFEALESSVTPKPPSLFDFISFTSQSLIIP